MEHYINKHLAEFRDCDFSLEFNVKLYDWHLKGIPEDVYAEEAETDSFGKEYCDELFSEIKKIKFEEVTLEYWQRTGRGMAWFCLLFTNNEIESETPDEDGYYTYKQGKITDEEIAQVSNIVESYMGNYNKEFKKFYDLSESLVKSFSEYHQINESASINYAVEINDNLENKFDLPFFKKSYGYFGGSDTLFLTISFNPKSEWKNGIFENSIYVRIRVMDNGEVDLTTASGITSKMRTFKGKSTEDIILKINKYLKTCLDELSGDNSDSFFTESTVVWLEDKLNSKLVDLGFDKFKFNHFWAKPSYCFQLLISTAKGNLIIVVNYLGKTTFTLNKVNLTKTKGFTAKNGEIAFDRILAVLKTFKEETK